jgi:uracil DNA glycosylase superfamily
MENLELKMKKLFEKWKQEHKDDKLYEYDTPSIDGKIIPKENFISDGFCVSNVIKENTILYIAKESHEYDKDSIINKEKINEYKYLKKCFADNKNTSFPSRIRGMQEILGKDIKDMTFMNINKRGGFSYTNMAVLNTYAMQFSDNIVNEIEIINPELIICCGIGLKRIINMVYTKCDKELNRPIVEVNHPSYVISKEKYLDSFREELRKINKFV